MDREFTFKNNDFKIIAKLVHEQTGIVLAEHKRNMVYSRLARRLRELKYTSFKNYLNYIQSTEGEKEIVNFVNAITTNLTSFFREKHHFQHLEDELKKQVKASPQQKRIRIWSSASSSGQEPYSIAMVLKSVVPTNWDAKILATDIDTNMINKCQIGEYPETMLENIPQQYRKNAITRMKSDDTIQMSDSLKQLLTFKQLNLLNDFPMKGPFDFIFCRNVVIYFDKDTQTELFDKIANILKPNGILYIGHSESLFKISDRFKLIGKTIYQKLNTESI